MTRDSQAPPRAWQRMLSGRRLDLLAPRPEDIAIEDIAHGLARVARWNGQTVGNHAFSVAQHSLVVMDILALIEPGFGKKEQCAALLHDAPEYVVGDLISPFKAAIGLDYKSFEQRLLDAIYRRFGINDLDPSVASSIKRADTIAAYYEATALAGFDEREAELYFSRPDLPETADRHLKSLTPWPTNTAQSRFLEAFAKLADF